MKISIIKRALAIILVFSIALCFCGCFGGNSNKVNSFYETVSESQVLLDSVADDIYTNWHDAIYNDEFDGDIDIAVLSAQTDHESDLEQIEILDSEIAELFADVKSDKNNGALIKEIMSAYSKYYEFVVNVSGSFDNYSANQENLKKELASLLRDLYYAL